jgi:hypothetical protein
MGRDSRLQDCSEIESLGKMRNRFVDEAAERQRKRHALALAEAPWQHRSNAAEKDDAPFRLRASLM